MMRVVAACCVALVSVQTALAQDVQVASTPLHDAIFAVDTDFLSRSEGAWRVPMDEIRQPVEAVDPAHCAHIEDWSLCSGSVEIVFGYLGVDVLARRFWGIAEGPGAERCTLDAIVPMDRTQAFPSVFSELELYHASGPERIDQHLWQASAAVAEQLATPEIFVEQCKALG